jgi:hypothetical protein
VSLARPRVGIIQSNYIPWRGYFDFIRSVDLFVAYDDVQYSTGGWRNRNRLKMRDGLKWITVPVHASLSRAIDETPLCATGDWRRQHRRLLEESLGPAPCFDDAVRIWVAGVAGTHPSISALNVRLMRAVNEYLEIRTPLLMSRAYPLAGAKTERLIELLVRLGAGTYVSGPSAKGYLDEDAFRRHRIRLEYKTYDYEPYPQLWGAFAGAVTVLDLIANLGPQARQHLSSRTANEAVVSTAEIDAGAR